MHFLFWRFNLLKNNLNQLRLLSKFCFRNYTAKKNTNTQRLVLRRTWSHWIDRLRAFERYNQGKHLWSWFMSRGKSLAWETWEIKWFGDCFVIKFYLWYHCIFVVPVSLEGNHCWNNRGKRFQVVKPSFLGKGGGESEKKKETKVEPQWNLWLYLLYFSAFWNF